jgi:ankyrin repeat protein
MIDHLVEEYGVDPNGADGWTALHFAAEYGRVRTVKHLVEKHNVDIHQRSRDGETALDKAERYGRTECADVLRGYGAKTGEELPTESDYWYSDDSSDADHDVM